VFWPLHAETEQDDSKKSWKVVISNVGDSRAMILRKDGTCVSLSKDHKPEDEEESARIQRAGGLVRDNRVDGQLAMSRAIGDYHYKNNTSLAVEDQKVIPVPEFQSDTIYHGDQLFICCDGIVEHMENEDACLVISEELKQQDANDIDPAMIIPAVFEKSLATGSKDNMSGVLLHFGNQNFSEDAKAKEYLFGPFTPYQNDETFYNAYRDDCIKHGVEEGWLEKAQAVEAPAPAPPLFNDLPGLAGMNMTPQKLQQMLPFLLGSQPMGMDDDDGPN